MTKIQKYQLDNEDLVMVLDNHFKNLQWFDKDFKNQKPEIIIIPSAYGDCIEITYKLENAPGILAKSR